MKTLLAVVCFLAALTAGVNAGVKPDFSGSWTLDAQKSNFGPLPVPAKFERVIRQNGSTVHVTTNEATGKGEQAIETNFRTDGEFVENRYKSGVARVSGRWDADRLEVETRRELEGKPLTSVEIWSLSADRRTLTVKNHIETPNGPLDLVLSLRRE